MHNLLAALILTTTALTGLASETKMVKSCDEVRDALRLEGTPAPIPKNTPGWRSHEALMHSYLYQDKIISLSKCPIFSSGVILIETKEEFFSRIILEVERERQLGLQFRQENRDKLSKILDR